MSADSDEGLPEDHPVLQLTENMGIAPYNEAIASQMGGYTTEKAHDSVGEDLADQTTPTPEGGAATDDGRESGGGPLRRFNDMFTNLGSVQLEALALDGFEISNAIAAIRDEMYRNEFPLLLPAFVRKCTDCGGEYDEAYGYCPSCSRDAMLEEGVSPPAEPEDIPESYQTGSMRGPDPKEKRRARELVQSVNKEGQSLRELMQQCEDDQGRIGVSTIIIRKEYGIADGSEGVFRPGHVLFEKTEEIVRGDPKRIVPVVDENGRIGGHWWTCPVHRDDPTKKDDYENGKTRCDKCAAELREVHYVERNRTQGSRSGADSVEKYFFDDEVVTWARYYPRLHGLDGLSPVHHVWLKQAILKWMDVYGGAFYDPNSDQYPNKFMVVHTTNPDSWRSQLKEAQDEAEHDPYTEKVLMNQYSPESNSTPEVQVIDLMNDELLGQDEQMRKSYKSDIRTEFGITDAMESELDDAGGLNNEGLQLEVTDRKVANAMKDTKGPLNELREELGISDWKFAFVPPEDKDLDQLKQAVNIGKKAAGAGLDASMEDGELVIKDGDFEGGDDEGGGGLGGLLGESEEPEDDIEELQEKAEDAGPDIDFSGDLTPDEAARLMEKAYEHIVWADDPEQKADPFWADSGAMPDFIKDHIAEVIDSGVLWDDFDSLPGTVRSDVEAVLADNLTQPQGWSLRSITDDFQDALGIDDEDAAETVVRTEVGKVLNETRERAYEESGDMDDRLFRWIGPQDDRTTDACEWLKDQTEDGVTWDELIRLQKQAADEHFDHLQWRKHLIHPNERHTFTETFKAAVDDLVAPWRSTGTFAEVPA